MIMAILPPTVLMAPITTLTTALTCGRAGMDGGIHSGSTDTTTLMVPTIPISGAGIHPDLEADIPEKQSLRKDS